MGNAFNTFLIWAQEHWAIIAGLFGITSGIGGGLVAKKGVDKSQNKRIKNIEDVVADNHLEMTKKANKNNMNYVRLAGDFKIGQKMDEQVHNQLITLEKVVVSNKSEMDSRLIDIQKQIAELPLRIIEVLPKIK